jgi:glycosyltransferase involved in cell wall biosynthesis
MTISPVNSGAVPKLAVVMPVYQDPAGARISLQSLGRAAYPCSTTIIIVDDGSEPALALGTVPTGLEVRLLRQTRNQGIEAALNLGFAEAAALGVRYAARLDAGDLVATERFELQYAVLESHPEIGIVGSSARFVDKSGAVAFTTCPPAADSEIRRAMHINCCLLHPTVMMRMSALATLGPLADVYSRRYAAAEDYDLFLRLLGICNAANIALPLVDTLVSATGLSGRRRRVQLVSRLRLQLRYFDLRRPTSTLGIMVTLMMMLAPGWLVIFGKRLLGRSVW